MAAGAIIIYALCDPVSKEPRYIGKANNLASRIRCHRWEAQSSSLHTHKVNWLRSLGVEPIVKVLEEVDNDNWQEVEKRWIAQMRNNNVPLTNFADGGQTSPVEGKGHTEKSKTKMREAALRNGANPPCMKGYHHSEETKAKLSATRKGMGTKPPSMGGWNKGIHKAHCRNGHEFNLENTVMIYKNLENRFYQGCKICRYNAVRKYQLKQQEV